MPRRRPRKERKRRDAPYAGGGATERIRTPDLRPGGTVLYQLSYRCVYPGKARNCHVQEGVGFKVEAAALIQIYHAGVACLLIKRRKPLQDSRPGYRVAVRARLVIRQIDRPYGGDRGTRTPGFLLAKETLYQLSYIPVVGLQGFEPRIVRL